MEIVYEGDIEDFINYEKPIRANLESRQFETSIRKYPEYKPTTYEEWDLIISNMNEYFKKLDAERGLNTIETPKSCKQYNPERYKRTNCECGGTFNLMSKWKHERTKLHQDWITRNLDC